MGAWWERRRYGLLVHGSLASVPAWAPIGQSAAWYQAHAFGAVSDALHHPSPMAETLAHHRDRWGHVETYRDFLPFLTFDAFDADEWAGLAADAGMGYAVMVAKHHDGLCWWKAPATDFTVVDDGPRRDVLAEFVTACGRTGLAPGVQYSLLDWADPRYPSAAYVDDAVHPQVRDLVERFEIDLLYGDGHWGAGAGHWRSDELIAHARHARPELVVNDRWWAADTTVTTFDRRLPAGIVDGPWEARFALGAGDGYNRAEPADRLLSPAGIVSLLTEVIAKGGHLLLAVGPDASGAIPAGHAERLRTAGRWVGEHRDLLADAVPWTVWGDDDCRYLAHGADLVVVDVGGTGRFAAVEPSVGRVVAVTDTDGAPVPFEQSDAGLEVDPRRDPTAIASVYRVALAEAPAAPIELFPPPAEVPLPLADAIGDPAPGSIVQLGDGTYAGPSHVPDGVTVRGLGPDRTRIVGGDTPAVTVGAGGRLEHCTVVVQPSPVAWLPRAAVRTTGDGATVIGCVVRGHVEVAGDDARVVSCRAAGVIADGVQRLGVSRTTFAGNAWDTSISITGGYGHLVDSCVLTGALTAIELVATVDAAVRGNQVQARWTAMRLHDSEGSRVSANVVEGTMRAVDVDGGAHTTVTGNAVSDGDSGCLVQGGATEVDVAGNHWTRCRIGLIAWDAVQLRHRDNVAVDLLDEELVVGP